MSNVTVQEALKAAVAAMETCKSHRYEGREANVFSQWFDEKLIAKSLDECKSALSDIEKCEPVYQVAINGLWLDATLAEYIKHNGIKRELYTSPQPREWVGLSDADLEEVYSRGSFESVKRAEAILKRLNAKG